MPLSVKLNEFLDITYPLLVAPMFLISNTEMVKEALDAGVTAAFPALNYRTDSELRVAIKSIKEHTSKPFGVNLIVNKSNPKCKEQLKTLLDMKVDYVITSLGNPKEVIECCHERGIKVFCDVVDLTYAQKVESLGADAIIAVNNQAGGHAGNVSSEVLICSLQKNCNIPIIAAGGIARGVDIKQAMECGAAGVSVGTIFIASCEAKVSDDYKQALIDYGAKDVVRTNRISGSPLTVINTPYVQHMDTESSILERLMNSNKRLKKYIKMLIAWRGMKQVAKSAMQPTYKTVWCAGPSIEYIHDIRPVKEIIATLIGEWQLLQKN